MEEDWWADDAPEDSVPDAPKEVVISGPVESGNMLKGGVNQISEDGQKGVWGHADQLLDIVPYRADRHSCSAGRDNHICRYYDRV